MKKVKVMMLLVVALFISVGSGLVARAQDSSTRGASGLSISPPKFEFTIERGKAELATIQVKNVTDDIVLAKAFLNDFEADGTTGNPKLIVDSKNQESTSLKEFVVGLDDITIQPGETVGVKVPIQIPEDAAPGAYYGAIRFLGTPPEETNVDSTTQLSLNASVAAIVLVEVPGDITEKIEVKNISAYLDDKKGSLFTKKPSKVGIEINNLGNGFSKPFGKVAVTGPWGKGEVHTYELNDSTPRGNILPNSTRMFKDDLGGINLPGRYTITAYISHGRGGEVITASSSFWYIPTWLVIVLVLFVLGLVGLAFYLTRKYKTRSMRLLYSSLHFY
jgi:hypothetical protein